MLLVTKKYDDLNIGDIIRATLGNPLEAIAKAEGLAPPAIEEQVRLPTANEMVVIEELASEAARLQDEIRDLLGDRQKRLSSLKDQLKDQMLQRGLKEINLTGRPPIELSESKNRRPTKKSIVEALQSLLGEKEGKEKGEAVWNRIEPSISYSLSIPDPVGPTEDVS